MADKDPDIPEENRAPQDAPAESAADPSAESPAETSADANAAEPEAKSGQMSEQEIRKQLEEHFREQDVSDVLMQFLISLSTLAYVKMGIAEDMQQYKDLEQASMAVDSFKAVLDAVSGRLPEQDAQALAGALASMQITFAKASEA